MQSFNVIDNDNRILATDLRATELNSRGEMSDRQIIKINELSRDHLIRLIIKGRIPFIDEANLKNQETEVLRRLTFLAMNQGNDLVS